VTYPSHFRSVVHDAVEDACAAHGFKPVAAHEVGETATLVSFVAAGLGVSLVPESVCNMTVEGAIYRPLAHDTTRVEIAVAWRRDDDRPVPMRALDVIRRDLR
jgi:DNA-binding transcriptional LysR family regulator